MRHAIVILLVTASLQVVYGQGQKPYSATDKKNARSIKDTSAPLPAPAVTEIKQQATAVQENGTKEHSESYFTRLFTPENIPNLILALVAIWGIRVAIRTLKAVERQTKATEDNVTAMIASERAWVDADLVKKETIVIRHHLEITNHGKTPARISSYELQYGSLPKDSKFCVEQLSRKYYRNIYRFLGSDRTITVEDALDPQKLFLNISGGIPESNEAFICLTVNYGDIVAAKPDALVTRKSSFVYKWNPLLNTLDRDPLHTRYT